jgi:hypothetical protein
VARQRTALVRCVLSGHPPGRHGDRGHAGDRGSDPPRRSSRSPGRPDPTTGAAAARVGVSSALGKTFRAVTILADLFRRDANGAASRSTRRPGGFTGSVGCGRRHRWGSRRRKEISMPSLPLCRCAGLRRREVRRPRSQGSARTEQEPGPGGLNGRSPISTAPGPGNSRIASIAGSRITWAVPPRSRCSGWRSRSGSAGTSAPLGPLGWVGGASPSLVGHLAAAPSRCHAGRVPGARDRRPLARLGDVRPDRPHVRLPRSFG